MTEEDEAFEDLAKRQGDWGMQGSRKHQIMRYVETLQRPWVGLTNEEIWTVLQFRGYNTDTIQIAKAVEAKLKEKNT